MRAGETLGGGRARAAANGAAPASQARYVPLEKTDQLILQQFDEGVRFLELASASLGVMGVTGVVICQLLSAAPLLLILPAVLLMLAAVILWVSIRSARGAQATRRLGLKRVLRTELVGIRNASASGARYRATLRGLGELDFVFPIARVALMGAKRLEAVPVPCAVDAHLIEPDCAGKSLLIKLVMADESNDAASIAKPSERPETE